MKALVTGSSGHLGEALVRTLRGAGHNVLGLDILPSPYTDRVGSITDRATVRQCMADIEVVFHAATLHKPHVVTHSRQDFVDTNVTGTLTLLEEAVAAGRKDLHFHQHDQRARRCAGAGTRGAGGLDHRRRRAGTQEHLRSHQGRGGGSLPALPPQPGPGLSGVENVALFPGRRRQRGGPRRPMPTRTSRPTSSFTAAETWPTSSKRTCWRPNAQRKSALRATSSRLRRLSHTGISRTCAAMAAAVIGRLYPEAETLYRQRGWRLPAAIDRVYVNARRAPGSRVATTLRLRPSARMPEIRPRAHKSPDPPRRRKRVSCRDL